MPSFIYGLCDPRDDAIRYIGKTKRDPSFRSRRHSVTARGGAATHVCNWLRSIDCKQQVMILEQGEFTPGVLNALEREWIRYGRQLGWRLTNQTPGGDGGSFTGRKHTPEFRAMMSEKMMGHGGLGGGWPKGVPMAEETKVKISVANRGLKRTAETRARMSVSRKNRPPMSDKTREKLRVANLGKKLSQETRDKMSAARTGSKRSDETRAKMVEAQRQRRAREATAR